MVLPGTSGVGGRADVIGQKSRTVVLFASQPWILEIQLFERFGPHQPTNVGGNFILAECLLRFEVV